MAPAIGPPTSPHHLALGKEGKALGGNVSPVEQVARSLATSLGNTLQLGRNIR